MSNSQRARTKPSAKTSGEKSDRVRKPVPQAHGGYLIPGAGGGPQPGAGRPPSIVRAASRESYYARIPVLESIADNGASKDVDRIQAVATLGKMGLSGAVTMDDLRERLRLQVDVLRRLVPEALHEQVFRELGEVWR